MGSFFHDNVLPKVAYWFTVFLLLLKLLDNTVVKDYLVGLAYTGWLFAFMFNNLLLLIAVSVTLFFAKFIKNLRVLLIVLFLVWLSLILIFKFVIHV